MQDPLAHVAGLVARAVERRTAALEPGSYPSALAALSDVLRADYGSIPAFAAAGPGVPIPETDRLRGVAEVFGLGSRDLTILAAAAGAELDANLALGFGLLAGRETGSAPSVGLLLEFVGAVSVSAESYELLGERSPLRASGLVDIDGTGPWLTRTVRVPDRVVAYLVEADEWDPQVRALARALTVRDDDTARQSARALAAGAGLVWLHSPLGTTGLASAAGALAALGLGAVGIDLTRLPAGESLPRVLRAACLDAGLRGVGLVVSGLEVLSASRSVPAADGHGERADSAGTDAPAIVELLWDAAVPVVGVARTGFDSAWSEQLVPVTLATALTREERRAAWAQVLGPELVSGGADAALGGLRLPPEDIRAVAASARVAVAARQEELTLDAVRVAAREQGTGRDVPAPPASRARFADLVLPEHLLHDVRRLISWAAHRDEVLTRGAVHGKGGKGTGIAALFTGSPGTGKTLSAHVIADELGVELMQVELSSVIDKYIGETEKNLERIFHQAESHNVVLFFDEADALFGSRSEVRDSRDRYANQEVSYLLQRMERFDGITLLATNLRGNLDAAFTRRLQFILHFPDPDQSTRAALWRHHLQQAGEQDPADGVDVDVLARSVELAGGDIRNIVLAATYDAVGDTGLLGMRHVRAAAVREYTKLGRKAPQAVLG